VDDYEELNDTLEANKEARKEALENSKAEAGSAEIMSQKLEELSKKENKSNAEKKQMQYYVDELNKIVPDLNLKYDAEKDALNKSTDAIRSNIKAQKDLAIAKAYQENMAAIAKDMADAQMKLDEATQQNTKNEIALKEAKEATEKAYQKYIETGEKAGSKEMEAWANATIAYKNAQENCNKSQKTVDDLKNKMSDLNKEYDKTDQYAQKSLNSADLEKKLSELTDLAKKKGKEIPKEIANSIREGTYAVPESVNEMKSLIKYDDMLKNAKENGIELLKSLTDGIASGNLKPSEAVKQMQNLISFSDVLKKAEQAGVDIPEKMKQKIAEGKLKPKEAADQVQTLIDFSNALKKADIAGEEIPESIKNKILEGKLKPEDAVNQMQALISFNDMLAEAGMAGQTVPENIQKAVLERKLSPAEAVAEMNRLLIKKADTLGPELYKSGVSGSERFTSGVNAGKDKAHNAGYFLGKGVADGTSAASDELWSAGINIANTLLSAVTSKQGLDEHSPSNKGVKIGKFAVQGVVNGVNSSAKGAAASMVHLAQMMSQTAKTNKSFDFENIGKNMITSYTNGVNASEKKAVSSVTDIVNKTVATLVKQNPKAKAEFQNAGKELISTYSNAIKTQTDASIKSVTASINKFAQQAQSQYDELVNKRKALAQTLDGNDRLLTKDDSGNTLLTDLSKSKNEIQAYGKNLEALKKTMPKALMEEITSMSFEDGKAYTDALMKMSKKERDTYVKTWTEREKAIKSVSDKFYADQIKSVQTKFNDDISKILEQTANKTTSIGQQTVNGMVKGMLSKQKELKGASKTLADAILKQFKKT